MKKIIIITLWIALSVASVCAQSGNSLAILKPTVPGKVSEIIPITEQDLADQNIKVGIL